MRDTRILCSLLATLPIAAASPPASLADHHQHLFSPEVVMLAPARAWRRALRQPLTR